VQNRNSWRGGLTQPYRPGGAREVAVLVPHGLRRGLHSLSRYAAQTTSTGSKLNRHRLAIRRRHFEELALLEAEHSGENVRRE
jgi:hypothetical protein